MFRFMGVLEEDLVEELRALAQERRLGKWKVASKRNTDGQLVVALIIDDKAGATSLIVYEEPGGVWSFDRLSEKGIRNLLVLRPGYRVENRRSRRFIFGPLPSEVGLSIHAAIEQGVAICVRTPARQSANDPSFQQ